MPVGERRKVEELFARLQYEPTEFDVVVEGHADKAVVDWYLKQIGVDWVAVYPASEFSIDTGDLPGGERTRVLSLAQAVDGEFPNGAAPILFVIDKDLDLILDISIANQYVTSFDGPSLEILFNNEKLIERFLNLYLQQPVASGKELLAAIEPVGRFLYLLRAADQHLHLNCGAMSFENTCTTNSSVLLACDREEHLRRYLMRSGKLSQLETLKEVLSSLDSRAQELGGWLVHGHDFVELLCFILRPYINDKRLIVPDVCHRALTACLDLQQLDADGVFQAITRGIERVGRLRV
jgi:hypothetical protein